MNRMNKTMLFFSLSKEFKKADKYLVLTDHYPCQLFYEQ